MIPREDSKTGCLPVGCYDASLKEFKERFVDDFPKSKSRESRFKGFVKHSKNICDKIKPIRKLIVDGSFTSNKLDPYDVDYIFVVNQHEITSDEKNFILHEKLRNTERKRLRHRMEEFAKMGGSIDISRVPCCDCFFIYKREPTDKKYKDYLKDRKKWLNLFGHSRPDKETGQKYPKGLINLILDSKQLKGI